MNHGFRTGALLLLAASQSFASPAAQWRQPLYSVTRQEVRNAGFVLGAPDNDIALSAISYASLLVEHRDPGTLAPITGQRLNQANVRETDNFDFRWRPVVACPDGGQIVVESGGDGLVKLDAQGKIVARRRIDIRSADAARLDASRILVVSRTDSSLRLMAVATADLSVQWIRSQPLPIEPNASLDRLAALANSDGSAALATVRFSPNGNFSAVEYVYSLEPGTGTVRWSTRIAGDATTPYINADALSDSSYFVSLGDRPDIGTGPTQLRRYAMTDGSPGWQATGDCPLTALEADNSRVFAAGTCGARLLDASTGQPLWSKPMDLLSAGRARLLSGGDVLLSGLSATADSPTSYERAFLRRLSAATGATVWQWDHPMDADNSSIRDLRVAAGGVYAITNEGSYSRLIDGEDLFHIDADTGGQLGRVHLDDPSPVYGSTRVLDSGHVLLFGSSVGLERNEVVVRKLASADGTPDWTVALSEDYALATAQAIRFAALSPGGALGVFAAYPYSFVADSSEALELYEVDVATGTRLWRKRLTAGSNAYLGAKGLTYDIAGNPVIAYSFNPKPFTFGVASRTLAKYARQDGAVLWSLDLGAATLLDAIAAIGDDLMVQSRISSGGITIGRVERRSGADGKVIWSHDLEGRYFSSAQSIVAPNGDVLVATPVSDTEFFGRGATLRIERLDAATGAPLWAKTFNAPRNTYVPYGWLYLGSDGGLYSGYPGRYTVNVANAIVTQRLDPATGDVVWRDERHYRSARGVTYSSNPDLGADGVLRVRGTFDGSWSAYDLEFQATDGHYLGARKQYACQFSLSLIDDDCGGFFRRDRYADGSLYGSGVIGSATEDSTQTAVRTIPALPLRGELELTQSSAPTATPFGDVFRRGFTATITYRGTPSTHPFSLRLLSEAGGGIDHWTCSAAGASSCGTAQGQGEVVIDAGLADGDTVTISGQVLQDTSSTTWLPLFNVDPPYDVALGCMANDNLQSSCQFPIFDDSFE